jgi:osmotically-inducible protein OsmY
MKRLHTGVLLAGMAAGATAEYLLDPDNGRRRRNMLRDQAMGRVRRGAQEAGRRAQYAAGRAQGVVADATPPGRDASEMNEPTLKSKVESELFRPEGAPKGSVDVTVEERVVFLRGEVGSEEQIEQLLERTRRIDGVERVESQLVAA